MSRQQLFLSSLLLSLLAGVAGCGSGQPDAGGMAGVDRSSASAAGGPRGQLDAGAPSAKVLELHRVDIPKGATDVFSRVDDGWSSYGLWLTFRLPKADAERFLAGIGVSSSAMQPGFYVPEARLVGWKAEPGRKYLHGSPEGTSTAGTVPGCSVSLDVTDPSESTVYLSSILVP